MKVKNLSYTKIFLYNFLNISFYYHKSIKFNIKINLNKNENIIQSYSKER